MRNTRNIVVLILFFIVLMFGWPWLMNKIWPPREPGIVKAGREVAIEGAVNIHLRDADIYVEPFGIETAALGAAITMPDPDQEVVAFVAGGMSTFVSPVNSFGHIPPPATLVGELVATAGLRQGIPRPSVELVASVTGGAMVRAPFVRRLPMLGTLPEEAANIVPAVDPANLTELIGLGHGADPYYLKVLLNTRGGSVQQVVLSAFDEANREGLEVRVDGKPKPFHLVPGLRRPRAKSLREQSEINAKEPELQPGKFNPMWPEFQDHPLAAPSYVMFHYEKPGDDRPVETLGDREWKVVEVNNDEKADEQRVVFQTELGEPHNLIITKTFTLKRKEYHLGMQVDFARIPGKNSVNQFRYQIQGAHSLPLEGEWYTSTFHQIMVGFADDKGTASRYIEDAAPIREWDGSDRKPRTDKLSIRYAATTVQYFASVIAVDDQQENRRFIEFVRATPWGPPPKERGQEFLNDATVRTITGEFDPAKDGSHKYLLYQGPIKIRLLRQMPKGKEVDDALVERYLDKINLDTMTDSPMPNFFGRVANAIYWSDLVIAFTNLIHSLLYYLYQVVPNLGICIILLTIIVRGLLHPLSRRQAYNAQIMQQKMAILQPELRKLQEKYKDDFHRMNQERMKLYREHGVNPFAALGGCFILLLQMPVFMGLYYALQESVFFRLERFLWIPNLAAPDMLIRWGESIPFISTPNDIGATLYLGPYFNVLPIVAVILMLYQQKKMMPVSDDPQVQAQQRMMKFMMILFGLFFYKVAAGLCLYFIASSVWGLIERKFTPKAPTPEEAEAAAKARKEKKELAEERPLGWWGRYKAHWKEKWKRILEEAQKQAEHRREQSQKPQPPSSSSPPPPSPLRGGKKKRKKN